MHFLISLAVKSIKERRDKMIYLAFALASLIFIIPAAYFIPSDLTKKGKMLVVVVSILLGLLGLTANDLFTEWQVALLLLLLIMAGTYLANNKITGLFHAAEETGALNASVIERTVSDESLNAIAAADQETEKPAVALVEHVSEEDNEDLDLIDFSKDENSGSRKDSLIEGASIGLSEEESHQEDFSLEEIESMLLEEVIEENALQLDEKDKVENPLDPILQEINYLSELEDMMNEEMEPANHTAVEIREPEDQTCQDELKISDHEPDEYFAILNVFEDSGELREHYMGGETEYVVADSEEHTPALCSEEAAAAAEAKIGIKDESGKETKAEEKRQAADPGSRAEFQNQMFQLIAPQLELARNSLDKKSYEMLVIGCMNPNMQPSDYYTFARLLFDHYIIHKEFDKLLELAESLEARFSAYPVLKQEIKFIQMSYAAAAKRKNYKLR